MTEIEERAFGLLNAVRTERGLQPQDGFDRETYALDEALCRAIEQREAFKQEVSDAITVYFGDEHMSAILKGFIITKPDPLVEAMTAAFGDGYEQLEADNLRAMLEARGYEIREKGA